MGRASVSQSLESASLSSANAFRKADTVEPRREPRSLSAPAWSRRNEVGAGPWLRRRPVEGRSIRSALVAVLDSSWDCSSRDCTEAAALTGRPLSDRTGDARSASASCTMVSTTSSSSPTCSPSVSSFSSALTLWDS